MDMSWFEGQFTLTIDGAVVDNAAFLGKRQSHHYSDEHKGL